jgi:hypothetical protein
MVAMVVTPREPLPPAPPRVTVEPARRIIEPIVIAVATSTGVYLVGSVYTEASYGRKSIDATALDLTPPYIALQAFHVLQSLLVYPVLLLLLYYLSRAVMSRLPRVRTWTGQQFQRFGRVALLVVNGLVVVPLILVAATAGSNPALIQTTSTLSEVASLMQFAGFVLVIYALWLSLGPRKLLLTEIQQHRVLPIVLVFALYLLGALVQTADRARANAERLMIGASDTSVAVTFTMASGAAPPPSAELILVAIRNGHYFVVERQPDPPSRTPSAYAIPIRAVDAVHMERVNPAAPSSEGIVIQVFPTTPTP